MSKKAVVLVAIVSFLLGGGVTALINNNKSKNTSTNEEIIEIKQNILSALLVEKIFISSELKNENEPFSSNWWYLAGKSVLLAELRDDYISYLFPDYEPMSGRLDYLWIDGYLRFWEETE